MENKSSLKRDDELIVYFGDDYLEVESDMYGRKYR